jgi:hypothetical protein
MFVEGRDAKIYKKDPLLQKLSRGPDVPLQPVADVAGPIKIVVTQDQLRKYGSGALERRWWFQC